MPPPTGVKPPPINGWMRCDLRYRFLGVSHSINTFWFRYDGTEAVAADDTDLDTIEAKVRNAWLVRFGPSLSNALLLNQVRLILFRASGELALTYTTAAVGSETGAVQGAQQAAVVNWDTHSFYRGGKPKTFLPGLSAEAITNPVNLSSSWSSSLEAAMNAWITDVGTFFSTHLTTHPALIVPSWSSGGAYRTTAVERRVYRAWVQPRICTQRRRLGAPLG